MADKKSSGKGGKPATTTKEPADPTPTASATAPAAGAKKQYDRKPSEPDHAIMVDNGDGTFSDVEGAKGLQHQDDCIKFLTDHNMTESKYRIVRIKRDGVKLDVKQMVVVSGAGGRGGRGRRKSTPDA